MDAVSFIEGSHKALADEVQKWLDEHPGFLVTHLAFSSAEFDHCVTLLGHEDGKQHRYRFAMARAYSGSNELSEALAAGGTAYLLAQGGNRYGHWAALLFTL